MRLDLVTLLLMLSFGSAVAAPRPGDEVVVDASGLRLRAEPSLGGDVVAQLERGRWLRVIDSGPEQHIGARRAPWLRVVDPFAPDDGAVREGWVWGALLQPLPRDAPRPDPVNWYRAVVSASPQGPRLWTLHLPREDATGAPELGLWSAGDPGPSQVRPLPPWRSVEALHQRDVGRGRVWLWLQGVDTQGRAVGSLVPGDTVGTDALVVPLQDGAERSRFYLFDLDGDAVLEAVTLRESRDRWGRVDAWTLQAWSLGADGQLALRQRWERGGLMPLPDPRVVRAGREGGAIRVVLANDGALSVASQLEIRLGGTRRRVPVEALVPGERRIVHVPGTDGPGGTLEVVWIPAEVEADLDNNRLAVEL